MRNTKESQMKYMAWAGIFVGLVSTTAVAQEEVVTEPSAAVTQGLADPVGTEGQMASEGGAADTDDAEAVVENAEALIEVPDDAESNEKIFQASLLARLIPQAASVELAHCDGCKQEWTDCCCKPCQWTVMGEWLLLQPRGADVLFAERAPTCFAPPTGTEQIDFGAFSGFRFGVARTLHDGCSEIAARFTHFEANESDRAASTTGTDIIRPVLAFDPFATCDDSTSTRARASAGIDFDRADVDFRAYIDHGCTRFDWVMGFGYGQLNQDVKAVYDAGRVEVESDAWGYGLRLGGGAQVGQGSIRGFGHLDLTLLASNLRASYREIDDGTGVVNTTANVDRDLDRIIPILDLEVGLAMDVCKNTVLKCGYVYSIWFNVVTAPEFVESVQGGDLTGPSDTLTFDGVFARVEYTW
jgi:hypothetical protein